jgi:hypothetical protein
LAEFVIYADQKSLTHLNDQRLNTVWQHKVFSKLLGLRYRIVYKKGVDNSAADALSRWVHTDAVCCAISVATPQWCAEIIQGYVSDKQAQELLIKLASTSTPPSAFTLKDGLIRFHDRIWVGHNAELQQKLIHAFHNSPLGGHSGIPATIKRLCQLFAWPGLKTHVDQFVRNCPTCQQAKVE